MPRKTELHKNIKSLEDKIDKSLKKEEMAQIGQDLYRSLRYKDQRKAAEKKSRLC